MHDAVTVQTKAPPDRVWELIADVTNTGAFDVMTRGCALNRWRYQLEPVGDGTDATESFRLAPTPPLQLYWLFAGRGSRSRRRTNVNGMRTTLERIKAEVEGR